MNALVFGEVLWDVIDEVPHLGGAPLNFAAHWVQMGNEAAMISSLGSDTLGDRAIERVEKIGINTSLIQRTDKPTGYVPVTLFNGQPEYEIVKDVAFDHILTEDHYQNEPDSYDVFYFGSLIQRNTVSRSALHAILARHRFNHLFYDVNLRKDCYTQDIIDYSLRYCTILKVNEDEVEVISQMLFEESLEPRKFCEQICSYYNQIELIVITAGKSGCYIYSDGEINHISTQSVEVIDAVGAGDAFSAAFVHCYIRTFDRKESARVANAVGGFVASNRGSIPEYSDEIFSLIREATH